MKNCLKLRGLCLRHPWLGSLAALSGIALLFTSVWLVAGFHPWLKTWLDADILLHGLAFGAGAMLDLLMIFGLLSLGFAECSPEDENCIHAYRGRRTPLSPGFLGWVESLGRNPRRHHHV